MTEPKRWADEDATPLERSLLEAMRAERPGPRLSRRMRRAIGLGGTLVAVKLLGSGLAAAAIVASGIAITSMMENDAPAPPPAAPGSARIVERVAPPAPPPSAAEAHEESAPPSPSAAPRPVPQDAGQRAAAPRPSPPPAKIDAESALREEIRLLDGARAALRRGAPKQAREELDRYAARFPRGAFRQEASVLRIEALGASGERARATALARDFLRQHPESPHAERVARMLGGTSRTSGVER